MRKIKITAVLLIVCALLLTSVMTVYASADSKQVKKVINTFMKGAKKSNAKQMRKCFENPDDFFEGSKYSTTGNFKYRKSIFKRNKSITYTIRSIKIKNNSAKVKVRMRTPSIKKAAYATVNSYMRWGILHLDADENKAEKKMFSLLNTQVKKKGVQMYSHTVTFSLIKDKGKWKIHKATNTISDIPQGGVVTFLTKALMSYL